MCVFSETGSAYCCRTRGFGFSMESIMPELDTGIYVSLDLRFHFSDCVDLTLFVLHLYIEGTFSFILHTIPLPIKSLGFISLFKGLQTRRQTCKISPLSKSNEVLRRE